MLSTASSATVLIALLSATAGSGGELRNDYWHVIANGRGIAELRCDPLGRSEYGENLLAGTGIELGDDRVAQVELDGASLRVSVDHVDDAEAPVLSWSVPFRRDGFYDADAHRSYPDPDSLDWEPYREVFRKFVGGSGHARYVEEFKRVDSANPSAYGVGTRVAPLWLGASHLLLMATDRDLATDLMIEWPGGERVEVTVHEDRLTFQAPLQGTLRMQAMPAGRTRVPGDLFEPLQIQFVPDQELVQSLTGKRVSLNALAGEFMQQAIYFYPGVITGGDWLHGAVSTHQLDDPRSPYWRDVGRAILAAANVGFDRCGHFGLMYCWGRSPNYGDGGFLAPSVDARHLHINWLFICSAARYALMTRDRELLRARRVRWVALDGDQPLCGSTASLVDPVLVQGDWRLDFGLPTQHTLGQLFTAGQRFRTVRIAVANEAQAPARAVVTLRRDGPVGAIVATGLMTLPSHTPRHEVSLTSETPHEPGRYYVELADSESGRKWDGGLGWWTEPDGDYAQGESYTGPFSGDRWALLKLLFEYAYQRFGPERFGVAAYDRAFGCGPNKSGRAGDPIVCVSYWEQFGGGRDLWASLWYPSACSAMAELARWQDLGEEAEYYDRLRREADDAFGRTFGREMEEHGERFYRYVACIDWDGVAHDYGHTHYNLEAVARGIADERAARHILDWLDRGCLSPDGGATWRAGIYDFWQAVPPFITVNNRDWQGLGGQPGGFPFGEVLAAGGTRLATVAPDLVARARVQGADAVWRRTLQVLDRYARPDRLTGGRIVADPGGRGRWHFGPPQLDRADIEGFREIFPDNGAAATALPVALLGLEPTAAGLRLTPQVPTCLEGFDVTGLGYGGCVWRVAVRARRVPGQADSIELELEPTWGDATDWLLDAERASGGGPWPATVTLVSGQSVTLRPVKSRTAAAAAHVLRHTVLALFCSLSSHGGVIHGATTRHRSAPTRS